MSSRALSSRGFRSGTAEKRWFFGARVSTPSCERNLRLRVRRRQPRAARLADVARGWSEGSSDASERLSGREGAGEGSVRSLNLLVSHRSFADLVPSRSSGQPGNSRSRHAGALRSRGVEGSRERRRLPSGGRPSAAPRRRVVSAAGRRGRRAGSGSRRPRFSDRGSQRSVAGSGAEHLRVRGATSSRPQGLRARGVEGSHELETRAAGLGCRALRVDFAEGLTTPGGDARAEDTRGRGADGPRFELWFSGSSEHRTASLGVHSCSPGVVVGALEGRERDPSVRAGGSIGALAIESPLGFSGAGARGPCSSVQRSGCRTFFGTRIR